MKKHYWRSTFIFVLLVSMMLSLLTACNSNGEGEKETSADSTVPAELIDIISNQKSEYVMVYDSTDMIASYIADCLWNLFYENYKCSLIKRADSSEYDYEIVIGNANREKVAELRGQLKNSSDFAVCNTENRLYLYAESYEAAKRMIITFRDYYIPNSADGCLSVEKNATVLDSQRPEDISRGYGTEIFHNNKTKYSIVYNSENEDDEEVAFFLKNEIEDALDSDVKIGDHKAAASEFEILVGTGSLNRDEYDRARAGVPLSKNDYLVTVSGKKIVLTGSTAKSLLFAAEYFVSQIIRPAVGGTGTFYECNEYRSALDVTGVFTIPTERLKVIYDVLNIYPTQYLRDINNWRYVSDLNKRDQALVDALIERIGESAVFFVGSSSALYDGMICKLDKSDYSRAATLDGNVLKVPAEFLNAYFKTNYATDQKVDLKTLAESKGYTYCFDSARQLAIVSPAGTASFANDSDKVGEYTNKQYKDRMLIFFNNPSMPEPSNNTEQSRVVIEDAVNYFPEDTLDYAEPTYICYYSPSILAMAENGKNVLYSAVEYCQVHNHAEIATQTVIKKSTDGGKTWTEVNRVKTLKWAILFNIGDQIYIAGSVTGKGYYIGAVNEGKSIAIKQLWKKSSGVFEHLIADGYLYFALDFGMASIPLTDDPLVADNWTLTQDPGELVTKKWYIQVSGKTLGEGDADLMEGSMVKGKDDKLYAIYRIESQPNANYAVMLKLSDDKKTLELITDENGKDKGASLLNFPTTVSRFTVKYDETSQKYICISNLWLTNEAPRARNVVGLAVSDDLFNWKVVDTLLVDREMINTVHSCWKNAFQYIDFDFDGNDLVMVVRETSGFSNTFHDGKYFTFYRVSNFRSLIETTNEEETAIAYLSASDGDTIAYDAKKLIA
ncbi:MAG: hypothetical protein IJZ80_09720 [Clostridia bacterium]|nr:hypothetical protein [Clostridia bacterium]